MRNKKGFTLIEILIVVAIIGILASIVLVGLRGGRGAALDARRVAELRQVQNALELYFNACGIYPDDSVLVGMNGYDNYEELRTSLAVSAVCLGGGAGTYPAAALPSDPRAIAAGTRGLEGDYIYTSDGAGYILAAVLEGSAPAGYDGDAVLAPNVDPLAPQLLDPFNDGCAVTTAVGGAVVGGPAAGALPGGVIYNLYCVRF